MARLSRLTFPKVQLLGLAEALKSFLAVKSGVAGIHE
jgi:hypothetical protein